MSFDDFATKLDALLRAGKSDADIVQISGGEPTVHPELERFVAHCFAQGVKKVYINTNGVRLGSDPALAERLAQIDGGQDRLHIYLQFDGFDASTYAQIRGARNLYPVKRRAVQRLLDVGLFIVPVMTVTRGVNMHEIAA